MMLVERALHLFPNVPKIKEKQKKYGVIKFIT